MGIAREHAIEPHFTTAMIIDDHPLFCDALSITLRSVTEIEHIETADLLETALNKIRIPPRPDVIVLDLNLPDVNGLDGLVRLRKAAPTIPIVVVSSMADNRMIGSTLKAGASGFVPKHSQRDVFRLAFAAVGRGEVFVPEGYVAPDDAEQSITDREDALMRLSTLTNQQSRILKLICAGKLNKQIAYDLSIAETTVKAHITAIMRKLGVHSRTQAVLIAQEAKFSNILPGDPGTSEGGSHGT
jgi:DNA-binding NarL/FixJ family response regulator